MSYTNDTAAVLYDTHAAAEQSVKELQTPGFFALEANKFLVLAHETGEEAAMATNIITGTQLAEMHVHSSQYAAVDNRDLAVTSA